MADNVTANAGSGGATFKTDDDGTAHWPYVKLAAGADNTQTRLLAGGGVESGALRVTVASDSTGVLSVDDNGASLTVDNAALSVTGGGVEASAMRVTIANDSTGVLSVDDNGGSLTVDNAALSVTGGGVEASALRVTIANDSTGVLSVDDNGGALTVDNGGTFAVQVNGDALTALQLIDNSAVNHDAAASAGVVQSGLEGRNTEPTAVSATGDAVRALGTMLGKQVVVPYAIPASSWSYASPAAVTDTADDEAKAAAGAGIRNYITGVQVFNGHDTVGTEVVIKDGSTVLWRGWAEQTGGGCSARFDPPLRGTANTAVNVANITNGSSTYFNLQGFVAAE